MWRRAAFVPALSTLAVYAQECVPSRPAKFEDLSEFHEDGDCCYQDPFERECGDLDFCFGVMISHSSSLHSSCCDLFPSCLSTKSLISSLGKLRMLSLADLSISAIIFFLSIPHAIIQMGGRKCRNALKVLSALILLLEIVDLGISSRIIQIARWQDPDGETAADTAYSLIGADCFKDPHDSPKIGNVYEELDRFETIQIVELAFECCLIVLHFAKVICLRNEAQNTAETFNTGTVYFLDAMELVLAGIAFSVLDKGISEFQGLYDSMKDQTAINACIHTCCFVNGLRIVLPQKSPGIQDSSVNLTSSPVASVGPGTNPLASQIPTGQSMPNSTVLPTLRPISTITNHPTFYSSEGKKPVELPLFGSPKGSPSAGPTQQPSAPSPPTNLQTSGPTPEKNLQTESPTRGSRLDKVKDFLLENGISDQEHLEGLGSPQSLAMKWIADTDERNVPVSDALFVQRYSLAVLYFATGGERWGKSPGWLGEGLECGWYGVNDPPGMFDLKGCAHSSEVNSISLRGNTLRGNIPPEIGALRGILYLDLSQNCLGGSIPPSIGKLEELKILRLEANALGGTLPAELLAMTSFTELYLYYNDFIGEVPKDSTLCKRKGDMYTTLDCAQCPEWKSIMSGGPCCDTCWYWWADNGTLITDDTGCEIDG